MGSAKMGDNVFSGCAGRDLISEAIADATAASNWGDMSARALLLGTDQSTVERQWTLPQLEALQSQTPCFVMRCEHVML